MLHPTSDSRADPRRQNRNDTFLSSIPAGLVCLASHQVAGRGRGGNSWISPAGCLQFSLVTRIALSESSRIVFVQYLFGLAVVEAVRTLPGYERIGVCLKWPNDIYADMGEGEGMARYKKIGGILVNSSFANGEFTIVTGASRIRSLSLLRTMKLMAIPQFRLRHQYKQSQAYDLSQRARRPTQPSNGLKPRSLHS